MEFMVIEFVLLLVGGYLLGSVPAAYLAARWSRGIDLRKHGTGNIGATNLLTVAPKWTGILVVLFDLAKGMPMIGVADLLGMSIAQQVAIGMAAVIGHNWPIFLRFNGGRGILTSIGIAVILPSINGYFPWALFSACLAVLVNVIFTRSTVTGILIGAPLATIVSAALREPLPLTLLYIAILLVMVARRLSAPRLVPPESVSRSRLLFNRLLFDRDIRDKKAWMALARSRTASAGHLQTK